MGRGSISEGEGISGCLALASGREVVSEVGIVARDVGEPEPSFLAAPFELGFAGEDSGLSPALLGQEAEFVTLIGQEEGGLAAPSGDRVVGNVYPVEVTKRGDHRGGRHRTEEGEVKCQGHSGRRELHFAPMENRLEFPFDQTNLFGVGDQVEGILARHRGVDLVSTLPIPFGPMAVALEPEDVAEVFEDARIGSALGADDPGILAVSGRVTRRELVPTVQVFATESPKPPARILIESVNLVAAAGTGRLTNWFTYANLLSQRGEGKGNNENQNEPNY